MAQLQEIFNRVQQTKKEQKEIRSAYKEALTNSPSYKEVVDQLKILKEKKKQIEGAIKGEFRNEFNKLDQLKLDVETDNEILSDIALNSFIKGEKVEITDAEENKYEPVFKVSFKKIYS